jgi:hypothetical protein
MKCPLLVNCMWGNDINIIPNLFTFEKLLLSVVSNLNLKKELFARKHAGLIRGIRGPDSNS